MTESEALAERRLLLLEKLCKIADEVARIDQRLKSITGEMIVNGE